MAVADRLPPPLDCTVLIPAPAPVEVDFKEARGYVRLAGRPAKLTGYLGRFGLEFETPSGTADLKQATGGWRDHFDLVLDLGEPALIASATPPLGYHRVGGAPAALEEALEGIPELVGEFQKPQFFQYDPDICAHSRSGIQACTRCLDTCPTDAIVSLGERLEVDANLCQGAGVCATACPTGAIRFAYPGLADTLERLRMLLKTYREAGGARPCVMFHGAEQGSEQLSRLAARLPEHVLPFQVEEVGSAGMDVWMSALAFGAAQVRLLVDAGTPATVVTEMDAQLSYARAILEGMGYPGESLEGVGPASDHETLSQLGVRARQFELEPAGFAGVDEKRTVLRLAIDHLYEQAPASRPLVSLPTGAPFGEVTVDADRCTLCMACVSQCPGKALVSGDDTPQLKFIEENCVQCAMCARTCPEDAIAPSPRYLYDPEKRRARRMLKEEEPFHCIACGKPFATRSVIEQMTRKLRSHRMFQGDALKRLKMCEDCRVRAMFAEEIPDRSGGGHG